MATEQLKGSARYLSFPFRVETDGGRRSGRTDHIREQIAQVLLTAAGERVFLRQFGIGAQQLLFMPMTAELSSRIEASLAAGVSEALTGEAEPGSIFVSAGPSKGQPEKLDILVRYRLAALNRDEEVKFAISSGELVPPTQEGN
ncbi:MAG: GPW/gp25 family protein [Rhodobacter sp.]|nr:GPW/gp25 family protein [Rhodobacter sp.]